MLRRSFFIHKNHHFGLRMAGRELLFLTVSMVGEGLRNRKNMPDIPYA
jgi:uncharacterized membrane protein (UPF0136 family)